MTTTTQAFISAVPQADASASDQHVYITLEGLVPSRVLAYRETPLRVPKSDPIVVAVTEAVNALVKLDQVIAGLRGPEESPAPPLAIRQGCAAAHLRVVAALARARGIVDAAATALKREEDSFFLPVPLADDDVAGLLRDQEYRRYWEASGETVLDAVSRGEHRDVLDAVCRFPVGVAPTLARNIRRGLVSMESPTTIAGFGLARERIEWGQVVVGLVESALLAGSGMTGPSPLLADDTPAGSLH